MRKWCELMNCITFYLDKAERGGSNLWRDDIHCARGTIMEHPSIIGDELAWAILNSSRPYESNPDKVPPVDLWKCFRHDKEWAWGADSLWHVWWTLNRSCKNMNNHFELDHSHGFSNLPPPTMMSIIFFRLSKIRTKAIRKYFFSV